MYKCKECGTLLTHSELVRKEVRVGEFWGTPAYKTEYFCPICDNDDFEEIEDEEDEDAE